MAHKDDEWLIAENEDGSRQYLIHTVKPRFWCRVCDDGEKFSIAGLSAAMANGQTLAEFEWLDEPENNEQVLLSLTQEANDFLELYEARMYRELDHLKKEEEEDRDPFDD